MIDALYKLFYKNKDDHNEIDRRNNYGKLCAVTGIALNIVLCISKAVVGVLSASIAIIADAFNNLSDAGSSIITLVGFKLSKQKPDKSHPFGHGRIEYVAGLAVALIIFVVGVELLKSSIEKIIAPSPLEFSYATVAVLVASVIIKLYMMLYNRRIGKKIGSPMLLATSLDSLSDSIATTVVLVSTLISHYTGLLIDGWCGIAVAFMIFYAGFKAAKVTINPLLGQQPEPELVHSIEQTVLASPYITGLHDLVVHDYGPGRRMISLHAEVPADGNIMEIHDAIDNLECKLNETLDCISVIHMDPVVKGDAVIDSLRVMALEAVHGIDDRITMHDFRVVKGTTHNNLIFDIVVPFDIRLTDDEIKNMVFNNIRQTDATCNTVISIDRPFAQK